MKKLLASAIAAASVATAAIADDIDICVEGAYPPFSQTDADGNVVGFDIDIANALCAQMGNTCTMVKTDWDGIIPALIEGKCDAIIASMTITEERRHVIDFTNKYYQTEAAFVGKEGMAVEDIHRVGVQRGTTHQAFIEGEFPDMELMLYGSQDEVYLDLQAGRLDASMADSLAQLEGFVNTDAGAGYGFVGDGYFNPKYHGEGAGIGVRQEDTALRDGFSAAVLAIRETGQYDEIMKKYFEIDIYGDD